MTSRLSNCIPVQPTLRLWTRLRWPSAAAFTLIELLVVIAIIAVLANCGGIISQTARLLGLDHRTSQRKLGKFPPNR